MKQLDALVWLMKKTYNAGKRGITFESLARQWENEGNDEVFQRRTFQRRINAIRELFGIHIKHIGNGFYAITEADNDMALMSEWFFNSYYLLDKAIHHSELKRCIRYEPTHRGTAILAPIVDAIIEKRRIAFGYLRSYEDATQRRVSPLGLYLYQREWYLLGEQDDGSHRCFALDRIGEITLLDEAYVYPASFSIDAYFRDAFGIFRPDDGKAEKVVLRFYGDRVKYIENMPLHPSQKLEKVDAVSSTFSYKLYLTPDLKERIMSFGDRVEVLSPATLRSEIGEKLKKAYSYYID